MCSADARESLRVAAELRATSEVAGKEAADGGRRERELARYRRYYGG
jgi:hypothetical protein